jgi:hypothetical protein
MHFRDLRRVLPSVIDSGVAIELISAPGRGKSEFVEQLVAYLSERDGFQWGFTTVMLATYSPADLMGYLVPTKRDDGTVASTFTTPAWMITQEGKHINDYKRAIVFLDEYGQGEPDTKRASAQLILKGEIGPHKLHDGIVVIAASNREKDRSGVSKSFDFVINRRVQFEISDDLASWEEWAFKSGVDPVFITFANQNPHIVFADGVPDKQGPWCTPRSLVLASKMLDKMRNPEGKIPTDPSAIEVTSGMIGQGAAAQLFAFIRLGQEMPQYADIIAKPDSIRVPSKPDAQMLVVHSLAARVTADDVDPVLTYIQRMPQEFAVVFAKAACTRDPLLVLEGAFDTWINKNSSLMAAISA